MTAAPQPYANTTTGMEFRLMRPWEKLPEGLAIPNVDPDWYWTFLAVRGGCDIVAMLMTGPYHNVVFLGQIKALPEAGRWWMRGLLRAAARQCMSRGYQGYMTFLDDGETCKHLRRVLEHGQVVSEQKFRCVSVGGLLKGWD